MILLDSTPKKNTMNQIEEKFLAIKRLEKSEVFSDHKLMIKILNYLVTAERDSISLKSTTIALEVLGDEKEFYSSQDAFIRAQIFRLRKKLELFYLTEGKEEKNKIAIPKGSYKVKLITVEQNTKKVKLPLKIKLLIGTLALLLLGSLYLNFFASNLLDKTPPIPALIAKNISNDSPTQIVVGERFFYRELDPEFKRFRLILDPNRNINSYEHKMASFIRDNVERKISISKLNYANSKLCLLGMEFKNMLTANNQVCSFIFASDLKEINQNIVFLGDIGSGDAWLLKSFLDNSNIRFTMDHFSGAVTTHIHQPNGDTLTFSWERSLRKNRKTYYLILKDRSANDNDVLLLLSGDTMARDYMNTKIMDNELMTEIEESFEGTIPSKYEILIEIVGQKKLGFQHKVVYKKNLDEAKKQ